MSAVCILPGTGRPIDVSLFAAAIIQGANERRAWEICHIPRVQDAAVCSRYGGEDGETGRHGQPSQVGEEKEF